MYAKRHHFSYTAEKEWQNVETARDTPWNKSLTVALPQLQGGQKRHSSNIYSSKLKSWGRRRDVPRHQSSKFHTVVRIALGIVGPT